MHRISVYEAMIGGNMICKMGAHIQRGMRPSGLGEVLDGATEPGVALDQQHITGV